MLLTVTDIIIIIIIIIDDISKAQTSPRSKYSGWKTQEKHWIFKRREMTCKCWWRSWPNSNCSSLDIREQCVQGRRPSPRQASARSAGPTFQRSGHCDNIQQTCKSLLDGLASRIMASNDVTSEILRTAGSAFLWPSAKKLMLSVDEQ